VDILALQWPEDDQSQDNTKQCNDKTSIHMDGFGRTNLFSIHTHLDLSFIDCLNVEEPGRSSLKKKTKTKTKKTIYVSVEKNSEMEFPCKVELPYSILFVVLSHCFFFFFYLNSQKVVEMLLWPKQQHAKIPP